MIQIIRKGKVDTYVAVCPYCGCKFTYQKDDLYFSDPSCVKCPMDGCRNFIAVSMSLASEEDLEEMNLNA